MTLKARLLSAIPLVASLLAISATAGTTNERFNVNIKLAQRDVCVSSSLSDLTHATVRVVCVNGHFVSIEFVPGRPFVGTHGGAHRFIFAPGTTLPSDLVGESALYMGSGTITSLRVLNLSALKDRLELLVSF